MFLLNLIVFLLTTITQMHKYRNRNSSVDVVPPIVPSPPLVEAWEGLHDQYGLTDMYDDPLSGLVGQSVDEEYSAYITAPISPKGTDLIKFWEASLYVLFHFYYLCSFRCQSIYLPHSFPLLWTIFPFRHLQCPVRESSHQVLKLTLPEGIESFLC